MKYIVFDNLIPVVFPEMIQHSDMAKVDPSRQVTGAGFYDGTVHGWSTSLNMGPGERDELLIGVFYGKR